MYIYICNYLHLCMYIHTHIYEYTIHSHINVCASMFALICVWKYATRTPQEPATAAWRAYIHKYKYTYKYIYIYIYIYIYVYICKHMYTYGGICS